MTNPPTAAVFIVVVATIFHVSSSFFLVSGQPTSAGRGGWQVLTSSLGISAMHVALLPNNRLLAFDRTDFGLSKIPLPFGRCRNDPAALAAGYDCTAHAVEFDFATGQSRPLFVQTDTWCSSGALAPDGTLIQTGGSNAGDRSVRFLRPCFPCDWVEERNGLTVRRWYASNQVLPDWRIIVVGGEDQFNYEFVPKRSDADRTLFDLPFLRQTRDADAGNNLYPFVHLSTDGHLFIFANTRSILLDYVRDRIVRRFPVMPGGIARNYPSTGSSVLLPLVLGGGNQSEVKAEVMICGGTVPYASLLTGNGTFLPASSSCGRLVITDISPKWQMLDMPLVRVMGDMLLLPTADVLIINGAARGAAGWNNARHPVLNPVLYRTGIDGGSDFEVLSPSKIPRMYHSTAHLVPDGRVLVGGSNPNKYYNFTGEPFRTELSLEAFSPPYLTIKSGGRPAISGLMPKWEVRYGQMLDILFTMSDWEEEGVQELTEVAVNMVATAFVTHSFSMNQRMVVLAVEGVRRTGIAQYAVEVYAPAEASVAPPGHYMLFVVHSGVPSVGRWMRIRN